MKTIDDGRKDGVKKRGPRMICRADVARELDLRDQLVAAAERVRLALTALDLADAAWATSEAKGILAALCELLVEAGAIDPMEGD